MARIEPFAEWLTESEDFSNLSLEELTKLRESGLLDDADGFEMYQLAVDKFGSDPDVIAATETLRKKFDLYTEAIFPYDDFSEEWEQIQNEADDNGPGELGWFEYLMFG
jgi:hypothetical protein